jgi:hypothetical protein
MLPQSVPHVRQNKKNRHGGESALHDQHELQKQDEYCDDILKNKSFFVVGC